MFEAFKGWTSRQKHAVTASYLGWTLDAMDFFLLVFVFNDIAKEFGTSRTVVTLAVTLTLAFRPVGACIFGRPYLSASRAKRKAGSGRKARVRVTASVTSVRLVPNSFAMSLKTKTRRKKSIASSVQPR